MPTLHVGDIDIYYEKHGEGPPVVFAHGAGGNHLSWWQQIPVFSREFTCITFDHRAFGRSHDHPTNGRGRDAFVDDLVAILDHLAIDRAAIVAQSMGGRTAVGTSFRHPERIAALVFAGTHGGVMTDESRRVHAEHTQRVRGVSLAARALGPGFAEREPRKAFLYRQIASMNPPRPRDFLAPPAGRRGPFSSADHIRNLDVPVMFLVGEHDAVVPREMMQLAHRELAGSRYVEIAGAGHSAYFEHPDAFNAAVLGFLRDVYRTLEGRTNAGRATR